MAKVAQERRAQSVRVANTANGDPFLPSFEVGHFVMMGKRTQRKSKLEATWKGPYEVVGTKNSLIYYLRKLDGQDTIPVHVSRIAHLATNHLNVTQELRDWAHDNVYEIWKLVDFRIDDDDKVELRVRWLGYEPMDETWEPILNLIEDQPREVVKFLKRRPDAHDTFPVWIRKIQTKLKRAAAAQVT